MTLRISIRARPSATRNFILRLSCDVLLFVGIIALGYCGFVLLYARLSQAYQARHFQQQIDSVSSPVSSRGGNRELPVYPTSLLEATRTSADNLRLVGAPGTLVGRIEISSIGLTAMVLEGTDEWTLQEAVGHIPGTSLPGLTGNVAIAGHRDTFFRALRKIHKNDAITLTTLSGSYRYLVEFTEVVSPDETDVLADSDEPILTLVTCYRFYFVGPAPKRFVVRAREALM
jgi:sortase A